MTKKEKKRTKRNPPLFIFAEDFLKTLNVYLSNLQLLRHTSLYYYHLMLPGTIQNKMLSTRFTFIISFQLKKETQNAFCCCTVTAFVSRKYKTGESMSNITNFITKQIDIGFPRIVVENFVKQTLGSSGMQKSIRDTNK